MQRSIALKKLNALLGKQFRYRINEKAPTAEERAEAKAALPAANEEAKRLSEQLEARRTAILAADSEFQTLRESEKAARKRRANLAGITMSYKITVGRTLMGMFFSVDAEGDSWEEIFDKLAKKKAA